MLGYELEEDMCPACGSFQRLAQSCYADNLKTGPREYMPTGIGECNYKESSTIYF